MESTNKLKWPHKYLKLRLRGLQYLSASGGNMYNVNVKKISREIIEWAQSYYNVDFQFILKHALLYPGYYVEPPFSNITPTDCKTLQISAAALAVRMDAKQEISFNIHYIDFYEKVILNLVSELERIQGAEKLYISDGKAICAKVNKPDIRVKLFAVAQKLSSGFVLSPRYTLLLKIDDIMLPYPYQKYQILT